MLLSLSGIFILVVRIGRIVAMFVLVMRAMIAIRVLLQEALSVFGIPRAQSVLLREQCNTEHT